MKPVVRWTIKQRKWFIIWWTIGVVAFIVISLVFYPSFKDQAQLDKQLESLPKATKALFSDTNDFFSPVGYLSSQVYYLMLPLLFSILSIGLGAGLLAREEDSGTIELLLARPISRGRLLAGKAAAGLATIALVGFFAWLAALVMCRFVGLNFSVPRLTMATVMAVLLALIFGSIAFTVTTLGRSARLASVGLASLAGIASYIISSLSGVVAWLEWPSKALPYHYYRPGDILAGASAWREAIGLVLAVAVFGIICWLSFRRRDLNG